MGEREQVMRALDPVIASYAGTFTLWPENRIQRFAESIADAVAPLLAEAPMAVIDDIGAHQYLSTYCLHGEHRDCRLVCKVCDSPCRCSCHDHG